ncbi:MAG TPA: stalk domain-containing protein [Armatimonadota bacterium]|nr:stalk domain-containing protein [Armatimonadota bacterium]
MLSLLHRPLLRFIIALFSAMCLGYAAYADTGKDAPVKYPTLSGHVQFVSNPPKDHLRFSYAVLSVDSVGRCVNNTLPMRFDLDTRDLTNGLHTLKVVLYDEVGNAFALPPFTVNIANSTQTQASAPKNTPPAAPSKATQQHKKTEQQLFPTDIKPTILYNNVPITFSSDPFIIYGRTMVLLRSLIESTGGSLAWHGTEGVAMLNKHKLVFTLNDDAATIDDKMVTLARPVIELQHRIFAPVTLWRDLLGGSLIYEHKTRSVWLNPLTPLAPATEQNTPKK